MASVVATAVCVVGYVALGLWTLVTDEDAGGLGGSVALGLPVLATIYVCLQLPPVPAVPNVYSIGTDRVFLIV